MNKQKTPHITVQLPVVETYQLIMVLAQDIDMCEVFLKTPSSMDENLKHQIEIKSTFLKIIFLKTVRKPQREIFIAHAKDFEHIFLRFLSRNQQRHYKECKPALLELVEKNRNELRTHKIEKEPNS